MESNRRQKVLLAGSSGHAMVLLDMIQQSDDYQVVGILDDFRQPRETFYDYPVLGGVNHAGEVARTHGASAVFVAVGNNYQRSKVVGRLISAAPFLAFPLLVHPKAVIGMDCRLGQGTVVMANAVLNPGCRVGNFCILNTGSILEHESEMGDYSSLGPAAATGGKARMGGFAVLGLGAYLERGHRVGENTVVGSGAMVVRDLPSNCVALGVPAKPVRTREPNEPYFGSSGKCRHEVMQEVES